MVDFKAKDLQNGKKFCIFAPTKTRCGKRDDTTAEATA